MPGEKYSFGDFQLDASELVLRRKNEIVPLRPWALRLLLMLVQSQGRLVSSEEIMERVWPGGDVEKSNLWVTIFNLRKALADGKDGAWFIVTVANQGYRFGVPSKMCFGVAPQQNTRARILP